MKNKNTGKQNYKEKMDVDNLKEEIEKIRHKLHKDIFSSSKKEILKTSEELDEVIIKYLKATNQK